MRIFRSTSSGVAIPTVALLLLLLAGLLVTTRLPAQSSSAAVAAPTAPVASVSDDVLARGSYLADAGDCVACHTRPDGAPYAGGRPLKTPFGTVLSANLTPDDATGIGRYTPDTFYRAMRKGRDHEGRHLYPAFPYNYFTRIARADSDALFAYLRSLPPVNNPLERNQLPFPFNIRALVWGWNLLFLDEGPYQPQPALSEQWNRGAYLVQGLGHCGACHTPKNLFGAPKEEQSLRGGVFANLFAPDITPNRRTGLGAWSRDALIAFLRSGRNAHSAASAEMGEAVAFSTSRLRDADLEAIATYLASVPAAPNEPVAQPAAAVMAQGRAIWQDTCSACHQMEGEGVPGLFPPLQANANLQQRNPDTVLHFILAGTRSTPTATAPTPLSMPPFAWKLNDAQVAAVATYARNSWGNAAPAVTAQQVADMRERLGADGAMALQPPAPEAGSMQRPGPNTLAPADTDSRDNGSAQAGRPVSAGSTP